MLYIIFLHIFTNRYVRSLERNHKAKVILLFEVIFASFDPHIYSKVFDDLNMGNPVFVTSSSFVTSPFLSFCAIRFFFDFGWQSTYCYWIEFF